MSTYGPLLWPIALTLTGMIVGALVVVLSRRARRVDDHPTCRRCRFDLVGLPPPPQGAATCPECGLSLAGNRAVRVGNRRLHRPLLLLGVLVVLGSMAGGGASIASRIAGAEVNRYKPAWYLAREARTGSMATANAALRELERRLRAGQLGADRAKSVVAMALARQADPNAVWTNAWGDYLDAAWQGEMMTGEERAASLLDGLSYSLISRKRMANESPVPIRLIPTVSRLGDATGVEITFELDRFELGGVATTMRLDGGYARQTGGLGESRRWSNSPKLLKAPLGEQELVSVWTVHLKSDDPSVPALTRTITLKQGVTVVKYDEPLIELLRDPEMAEQVRARISASIDAMSSAGNVDFSLIYSGLPCRVIGEAIARERNAPLGHKPREWKLCGFSLEAGSTQSHSTWSNSLTEGPIPADQTTVDVILRPSEESALADAGVDAIWGEEIVIEGVEVKRKKE